MTERMELENAKMPPSLRTALADLAARLGLNKSQVVRAAVKKFLTSDPTREEVLTLDDTSANQLRMEADARKARVALEGTGP